MELKIKTDRQAQLLDVTDQVNRAVADSGVRNGLCNVFVPHTTASVIISENADPDVTHDVIRHLEKLVPREAGYRHAEGNAQSHILSVMLGASLNIPVREGRLALGRWQGVMLAEFDGPRQRSLMVSLLAASA